MGRITDYFGLLIYNNEAEVSQNFLLPLLTEFLGYSLDEIQPEKYIPSFSIPQNREKSISSDVLAPNARPDYIVTIANEDRVFVCDSKGPTEDLDEYLNQLKAYCIALGTDLLLTTNGNKLRVYNANTLVFQARSVEELDLNYSELYKLLNREDAAKSTNIERIQRLDLPRSLSQEADGLRDEKHRQIAIALSDLEHYLKTTARTSSVAELPQSIREAFEIHWHQFPAEELSLLQEYDTGGFSSQSKAFISYKPLINELPNTPILLIGESGIGKTSLLQQIFKDQAETCLNYDTDVVPVLIKLGLASRNRSLLEMVHDELNSKGASKQIQEILPLLSSGRILLLLDAFDEVLDIYVPDIEREIQSLIEHYGKSKIIITTRFFRLPKLNPIRRYVVQPLGPEKISAFAKMYLNNFDAFLLEIERKSLVKLASNTLLLTFLILLFQRDGQLPHSKTKLLQAIVDQVRDWDDSKLERSSVSLSWKIREDLLTQLAFITLEGGASYAIDSEKVEALLAVYLEKLEARHQISMGLPVSQLLDSLAATGFVTKTADGILFWHRAFVEYFAVAEMARRLEADQTLLGKLIPQVSWDNILASAASKTIDPEYWIAEILVLNVFTAARTLIELNLSQGDVYRQVIDALVERCNSLALPIRRLATSLLKQIEGDYSNAQFFKLLDNKFVDVQKSALSEIARRKLPDAYAIVFSRLNWNTPTTSIWDGSAGVAVVDALGEFDDAESQLEIIRIWRKRPDIFTTSSCRDSLIRVARRGTFSQPAMDELLNFFLEDYEEVVSKAWEISDVLVALNDKNVAARLILFLSGNADDDNYRLHLIVEVLAATYDSEIIQQIIDGVNNLSLDARLRARFAEVLCETNAVVSFDVFNALAQDEDYKVKSLGLRGLGRFPFDKIRTVILQAIKLFSDDERDYRQHGLAAVQIAAFEALARHGQIELLLKEENWPKYAYDDALEIVFQSISDKRLHSLVPFLESVIDRFQDDRAVIKAVWTLADLGYTERAQEIIEKICGQPSSRGWRSHDILIGIHRLPASYAINVIDSILAANEANDDGNSHYTNTLCLEALERIGTNEAVERLANIVLKTIDNEASINSERALRAIEFLAPLDREDWLIELIEKHPQSNTMHRMLDTLGVIGSQKSLSPLQYHFANNSAEHIKTICYWAIQSIYRRSGILWFNGEERLERTQSYRLN